MERFIQKIAFILFWSLCACHEGEPNFPLETKTLLKFSGTFETLNSDEVIGEVTLQIENGAYECWTSLPFGRGAGNLEVDDYEINFVDTLFFPIPHLYGPSYTLSGLHQYRFDGCKLNIWKSKNVGEIQYEMYIEN